MNSTLLAWDRSGSSQLNPSANRLPLVTGPTIGLAAPRTSASPDG
jgi:hypothetical protein